MRPKSLLVLAAVVAALAAFIAFYERELPSSDERKAAAGRVFGLAADELVALTVEWGGATVRLARDAAPASTPESGLPPRRDWRLVEPYGGRADGTLADRLATELAELEIARRLPDAVRADVGLAPPRGRVRWATPDGEGELEIGGEIPASSQLVVAVSGRPEALVVAKSIAEAVDRTPGDWRAKEVLSASREEVERIRLVPAGGDEVVLSRRGEELVVERPFADVVDPDLAGPLLSDLTGLRAERFLDAPLSAAQAAGLAATAGRFELAIAGRAESFVVELGAEVEPGGERYARVAGAAIVARTRLADALARPAAEWRSKSWTGFESWRVERLRVDDAAGKLELVRSSGDWLRDGVKLSYTVVGDLLYALTSARAARLLAGAEAEAFATATPSRTLVLADANGAEETLTLYPATPAGVPARVSGREVLLELAPETVAELEAKLAAVRAAPPSQGS